MRGYRVAIATAAMLGGCTAHSPAADPKAIGAAAHGAYVEAINSNNVDTLMADLTDDIVYQSPNEPEIVGKQAVRKWAQAYVDAYKFHWDKTSLDFVVSGDWAFERYAYKATNTDRKTGEVTHDTGKGINIYHHDADGKWRVARDGWSSDLPVDG
jgi:ketosteroid isomerase-like protein